VTPDIVARDWGACNLRKIPAVLRQAYCRDWTCQTSAVPPQQKRCRRLHLVMEISVFTDDCSWSMKNSPNIEATTSVVFALCVVGLTWQTFLIWPADPSRVLEVYILFHFPIAPNLYIFLWPWTACVIIRSSFFAFANLAFTENGKLKNKQEMLCTLVSSDITIKLVLLPTRTEVKFIQFRRFSPNHRFSAAPACVANKHYAAHFGAIFFKMVNKYR